MRTGLTMGVMAVLVMVTSTHTTSAARAQSGAAQFRTGINLVEVDAVIRDRSGAPVRGLTKDDFVLFEDGKRVEVASFAAVDLPPMPSLAAIPAADMSGSVAATNDYPEDGRLFLLVVDDFHIRFDPVRLMKTKRIARRFIERLAPGDLAAAISTSSRRDMSVEFTGDKARLMAAVDRFFPQGEGDIPGIAESASSMHGSLGSGPAMPFVAELKARFAMDRLSRAARVLADIQHRRKAVVLVSEGMQYGIEQIMDSGSSSGDAAFAAMRDFILTAQRSNTAVYTFDAGEDIEGSFTPRRQNLRTIAEGTGGFASINTDDVDRAVDRMVAENGSYYLLGYYSPAKPYDGRHHRIRVQVSRPAVQVSAREGYVAERRPPKAPATSAKPLQALLAAPLQARGLPMHIVATTSPASSPGALVSVAVHIPGSAFPSGAEIETVVALADMESGKVQASGEGTARIPPPGDQGRAAQYAADLRVPPGRYQVRVVARTIDGAKQGSVFAELEVPKYDGDLDVGSLYLAMPNSSTPAGVREAGLSALEAALRLRVKPNHAADVVKIVVTVSGAAGTSELRQEISKSGSDFASREGNVQTFTIPAATNGGEHLLSVEVALGARKAVRRELIFRRVNVPSTPSTPFDSFPISLSIPAALR